MKLIYIYGPPAAGKLEVAKQLAKITGFRLFHNHLTADYVSSIFTLKDETSNKLKCQMVYRMLEAAIKYNVEGIIFTKVYDAGDKDFVKKIIEIIEENSGEVLFVKLYCAPEKLYERVTNSSRKKFDKVKSVEHLKKILKKSDKFGAITVKKSLIIDNTNTPAKKCAEKIKNYYSL